MANAKYRVITHRSGKPDLAVGIFRERNPDGGFCFEISAGAPSLSEPIPERVAEAVRVILDHMEPKLRHRLVEEPRGRTRCDCGCTASKRDAFECQGCGLTMCSHHIFQYVDESNHAITAGSPKLCAECYAKVHPKEVTHA